MKNLLNNADIQASGSNEDEITITKLDVDRKLARFSIRPVFLLQLLKPPFGKNLQMLCIFILKVMQTRFIYEVGQRNLVRILEEATNITLVSVGLRISCD